MKVKSIADNPFWSILQYFWPALRDNWSWKPIFGLFESGRFTLVLLYSSKLSLSLYAKYNKLYFSTLMGRDGTHIFSLNKF